MRRYAVLVILGLVACAPTSRPELKSLSDLKKGQVMLVGRVELVPPLQVGEQDPSAANSSDFANKAWIFLDPRGRPWDGDLMSADYDHSIGAHLGKTFMVGVAAQPQFVAGGMIVLHKAPPPIEVARLPPGLWIDIHPGDQAVYAGTIRYARNEYLEVSGVEVVDDEAQAQKEVDARFGKHVALDKRLAHAR